MAASMFTDLTSSGWMVTGARTVSVPSGSRRAGVTVRFWLRELFRRCNSLIQRSSEVQYERNCCWSTGGGPGGGGGAFRAVGGDCPRASWGESWSRSVATERIRRARDRAEDKKRMGNLPQNFVGGTPALWQGHV